MLPELFHNAPETIQREKTATAFIAPDCDLRLTEQVAAYSRHRVDTWRSHAGPTVPRVRACV